jgi:hypothetical protein
MRARLVGAAAAFALALVVDALLAGAPSEFADAPASLRGTSVVFVLLVASPVLVNPNTLYVGVWQKEVFGGLLLVVAMGGMHVGAQWTRFFDALLVAVLATGAIGLFSSSGIDVTSKKLVAQTDMTALVRKSAIAVASAFLLYAGLRILRVALVSPHRAAHLRLAVGTENTTTAPTTVRGYGVESDAASLLVAFGGAIAIGTAIALFAREHEFGGFGVESLRTQLSAAAAYTGLAGFATLLTVGDQMAEMTIVFHKNACFGDGCDVAAETRRAALQTPSTGVALLLVAAGLVTLNRGVRNDLFLNAAFFLAALAVVLRVDGVGVAAYGDAVAVVAVLAAWACVSYNVRLGCFVGYTALAVELVVSSSHYGAGVVFAHISNTTIGALVVAGWMGVLLGFCGRLCRSQTLLTAETFLATLSHAIALAYFLGSCGLVSSYVGGAMVFDEPALPPVRETLVFTVKHYVPLIFTTALYDQAASLGTRAHWTAWLLSVALPVVYGILMAAEGRATPALSPVDLAQFALFLAAALPLWVLAGTRA